MDAAYAYHVRLLRRTPATVSVSLPGGLGGGGLGGGGGDGLVMDFDVLHVLPFDSTRKRMSVILKHPMTNEIILYTKVQSGLIALQARGHSQMTSARKGVNF